MTASSSSVRPTSASPASDTSPSVGVSSPAMMFSRVDFPQPDGPITATNSAVVIRKSTPRNARTGAPSDSNVLRNPCVSTTNPFDVASVPIPASRRSLIAPALGASGAGPLGARSLLGGIPASRRSLIRQSPFHVVEHVDAERPHRRGPPFDRRLLEGHDLELSVQRRVRALVDHDPTRRPRQVLEPLRAVPGVADEGVLDPLLRPEQRRGHRTGRDPDADTERRLARRQPALVERA